MTTIQTFVFFDLETTGTPSSEYCKTRITELSMVAVKREHLLDTRPGLTPRVQNKLTLCFNPQRLVQPGSTEVTGLCNDLLEKETPFNRESFAIIDNFLQVLAKPICLIAHNGLSFDFPILQKHLNSLKLTFKEDILCGDSFFAFYDILEPKPKVEQQVTTDESGGDKIKSGTEEAQNKTKIQCDEDQIKTEIESEKVVLLSNDFTAMKNINETTPKTSFKSTAPSQNPKSVIRHHPKARRRLPWSQGEKPKQSYKLCDIYERLLNRPATNAHRAEADCLFMLESAVTVAEEFTKWMDENHREFSSIPALEIGK